MMADRIALLIDILLDKKARIDERDDAAMDLGKYNDDRALVALVKIASKPSQEDDFILDVCGESIGQILVKQENFRPDIISCLVPEAQTEAIAVIKSIRPDWLPI